MPRLSRWFIRAALIYLLLGFTIGGLILSNKGIPFATQVWKLLPVHIEFLLMGWVVQLAMGVAFGFYLVFTPNVAENVLHGWRSFYSILAAGL